MKLSIIILHYNTEELLKNCLNSLVKAGVENDWEVIIVDNCSTQLCRLYLRNLIKQVKGENLALNIKMLETQKNLGFAAGNNIGIREAKGEHILLLNSDTLVYPKTIKTMINFMAENPVVGVATCRVELENGKLDPACHRGFPTPWVSFCYFSGLEKLFPKSKLFGGYHLGYLPMDKIHEIDSPSGAFYLIKKEVIEKVGLFDEDYFMYAEDLDWSYRIKNSGWKIIFVPDVKITHLKKRSGRMAYNRKLRKEINRYFYETMKLFYQKHYLNKYPKILLWLVFLVIDFKKFLANFF